jgi:hypothetical protein
MNSSIGGGVVTSWFSLLAICFFIKVVALSASPTFLQASSDFGLNTGNE